MKSYGVGEAPSVDGSFDFGLFDGRGSPPRLRSTPWTKPGQFEPVVGPCCHAMLCLRESHLRLCHHDEVTRQLIGVAFQQSANRIDL